LSAVPRVAAFMLVFVSACGRINFEHATGLGDASDAAVGADFCAGLAPAPAFCADFDGANALDWGSLGDSTLGQLAIDGSASTSGPSSLAVTTPTTMAGDVASVYLRHDFTGAPTDVTMAFDLRIDQPGQGGAALAQVVFSQNATVHSIEYVYEQPNAQFEDVVTVSDVPSYTDFDSQLPSSGVWHHVSVRVQLGAAPQLTATLDGATTLDTPLASASAGSLYVKLGIPYLAGASSPWSVHFDSVTVSAQ
jgi:hypothetical protein